MEYQTQGQRKGDNGENYKRHISDEIKKEIASQIGKKHKIKWGGIGVGGGSLIPIIIMYILGLNPLTGNKLDQIKSSDSIEQKVHDNRKKMYTNKSDIDKLTSSFDKHIALQAQWEKNTIEKINQNQEFIKEQLKDIKERLPK